MNGADLHVGERYNVFGKPVTVRHLLFEPHGLPHLWCYVTFERPDGTLGVCGASNFRRLR